MTMIQGMIDDERHRNIPWYKRALLKLSTPFLWAAWILWGRSRAFRKMQTLAFRTAECSSVNLNHIHKLAASDYHYYKILHNKAGSPAHDMDDASVN